MSKSYTSKSHDQSVVCCARKRAQVPVFKNVDNLRRMVVKSIVTSISVLCWRGLGLSRDSVGDDLC